MKWNQEPRFYFKKKKGKREALRCFPLEEQSFHNHREADKIPPMEGEGALDKNPILKEGRATLTIEMPEAHADRNHQCQDDAPIQATAEWMLVQLVFDALRFMLPRQRTFRFRNGGGPLLCTSPSQCGAGAAACLVAA